MFSDERQSQPIDPFLEIDGKKRVSDSKLPIYARISIDNGGGSKEISTGIWLLPGKWDLENKVVLGEKALVEDDNDRLAAIRLKLKDIFKGLASAQPKVTASLLKKEYFGNDADGNVEPLAEHTAMKKIKPTLNLATTFPVLATSIALTLLNFAVSILNKKLCRQMQRKLHWLREPIQV